jgi:hypothetical protein
MNHISISQKIELIKEHKDLLVSLLEDEIKENEGYIYRYAKDNAELQEQYYNKILKLREIQAIINNF